MRAQLIPSPRHSLTLPQPSIPLCFLRSFAASSWSFVPSPLRVYVRRRPSPPRHSVRILLGNHQKSTPPTKPSFFEPLRAFPAKNHMSRCAPSSVSREFFTTLRAKPHHTPCFTAFPRTPPLVFCRSSFVSAAPLRKIPAKTTPRPAPLRQIPRKSRPFVTRPIAHPRLPAPNCHPIVMVFLRGPSWLTVFVLTVSCLRCGRFRRSYAAPYRHIHLPFILAASACSAASAFQSVGPRIPIASSSLKTPSHKKDSQCTAHHSWPSSASSRKNPIFRWPSSWPPSVFLLPSLRASVPSCLHAPVPPHHPISFTGGVQSSDNSSINRPIA